MPPSELDPILERLVADEVTEGTCIIRQGDPGDRFYLIRRGRVEVEQADEAGRIQTIAKLGTGDYFGERALVDDAPRAATVRALEPVSLWSLDRTGFQDLLLGQMRLRHSLSPAADRRETRGRLAGDETTG
jgi:CRP-like cAMP-binding protein